MMPACERLDPAWLAAALPGRVVCSRAGTKIELEISASLDQLVRLVHLLAAGARVGEIARLADSSPQDAERTLEALRSHGALIAGDPAPLPAEGAPLADAILGTEAGGPFTVAWTAEEILVLPEDAGPDVRRRALRWFVAGMGDDERIRAYGFVAARRLRAVAGDVPPPGPLEAGLARAREGDPESVRVVPLRGGEMADLPPTRLGRLGVERAHRLGPLRHVGAIAVGPPLGPLRHAAVAHYAVGNLASPLPQGSRVGRGTTSSAERSELLARAEAAERFGLTDVDPARLRRARAADLPSCVAPERLHRWSERQYGAHGVRPPSAKTELLWIEGRSGSGAAAWVPAAAVHLGLADPQAPPGLAASSSGGAAGPDAGDAAERAVRELIERDAFTWTWTQGVTRERIEPAGLPGEATALARAVETAGFAVALVNLTLETKPVIMAVLRSEERVHVALACRDDPRDAASKALDEAALVLSSELPRRLPRLSPQEVVSPEDHMRLYLVPERAEQTRFLDESSERIEFGDIASAPEPATEAVRVIGDPVIVDLTTPRTSPFAVARAVVPEMLPVSYGWDREPLGMRRLGEPRVTLDGRRIGTDVRLAGPIMPHPFP